jgi:hypothetical protein
LLYRRGLRLGGGKTRILNRDQVSDYIQESENQYLNVVLKTPKSGKRSKPFEFGDKLTEKLITYHRRDYTASTDKVIRRYYNAFSSRQMHAFDLSRSSIRKVYDLSKRDFDEHPDSRFRISIVRFWLSLPPTRARVNRLLKAATEGRDHDDVVTAAALSGLADVRLSARLGRAVVEAVKKHDMTNPGLFYGSCWILAKYAKTPEIVTFVSKFYPYWSTHELFGRQAESARVCTFGVT